MMTKTELNLYLNDLSESVSASSDLKQLRAQSELVRERYRDKRSSGKDLEIQDQGEAGAYLAWRWPVTAMVIHEVMGRLKEVWPDFSPKSVMDLGAGPAVSTLPVALHFSEIEDYLLWEEQSTMVEAGNLVLNEMKGRLPTAMKIHWRKGDFLKTDLPASELILASYAVNELSNMETKRFCRSLADSAARAVVLIVPGTPEHFKALTSIRNDLLEQGFSIVAPCTFTGPCKMEGKEDWCHFFVRVQRSKLLRQLKSAELSYEDEKFSYLILRRDEPSALDFAMQDPTGGNQSVDNFKGSKNEIVAAARIIRHPIINKGYREVSLCQSRGITNVRFTKGRHKEIYRELKRKGWGDLLIISPDKNED